MIGPWSESGAERYSVVLTPRASYTDWCWRPKTWPSSWAMPDSRVRALLAALNACGPLFGNVPTYAYPPVAPPALLPTMSHALGSDVNCVVTLVSNIAKYAEI